MNKQLALSALSDDPTQIKTRKNECLGAIKHELDQQLFVQDMGILERKQLVLKNGMIVDSTY